MKFKNKMKIRLKEKSVDAFEIKVFVQNDDSASFVWVDFSLKRSLGENDELLK